MTSTLQATYTAKKWQLAGLAGISDKTLETHFGLYEGYVKNTNALNEQRDALIAGGRGVATDLPYAELTRRLGFEYNGMVLHEYYFDNLMTLCVNVLRSAGDLATDGETWPCSNVQSVIVMFLLGASGPGELIPTLNRNVVVPSIRVDVVDDDVAGTERVDRVGVWRRIRRKHPDVADHDVRSSRARSVSRRVLHGDALDADVPTVVEDYQIAGGILPGSRRCLQPGSRAGFSPPALTVAVDHPAARNGDIFSNDRR